jgi:WD40 repeat protein/energy-coupling factor transporter ATP-binding protein EcfA2
VLQSLDDQIVFAPRWPASPFPGLRPFRVTATEDESLIFYGRNRAKDEILARLNSSHLVFVVGPSGCGKSSLLKVGVIPALEAGLLTHAGANWRVAEMRPGDRPVRNLAYALAALGTHAGANDVSDQIYDVLCSDENGLWLVAETLAPRAAPNPLLILIDQFEEVFGSQVAAQSESKSLLELIVAFWTKAHPNLFLVVTGILNKHADELLAGLSEREQRIAQVVFTRLSERDENRYRRSPTSAAALATLADCGAAELERVVSVFSDPSVCFLDRRPLAHGADELIDVSHESLIRQWDRLRGWADEEAEKVRRFRELAASAGQWQRHARSPSFLKRGAELGVWRQWWGPQSPTREWADRYRIDRAAGAPAPEPVALSKEYLAQSYKRVVRQWIGIGAAVVVGMCLVAGYPVIKIKIEKTALERARYETAAARGNDLLNNEDPNLALLLALEFLGQKEVYSSAIEALAYKALQTPRPKAILSAPAGFPTATFSPDGQLLLISRGNAFQVWKANELELVVKEFRPRGVSAGRLALWSADGQWIIGATDDNRTALFAPCSVPVPTLRGYFRECVNQNEDEVRIIGEKGTPSWPSTLSPAGNQLLTGGSGQAPQLWDTGSNPAKPAFVFRDGPANFAIAFNQQGDRLALGSTDGSVRIHDTANPTERFTLQPQTRCDASGENPSVQVFSLAFNPGKDKGDEMVSATLDGCLRLWNVKERRLIKDHNLGNTGFFFVNFDPSGRRIAMTSDDGSVRIWEPDSPDKPDLILRGHRSATWTVEFSRETGLLASASGESVRIWPLKPALHPSMLPAAPERFGTVTSFVSRDGALALRIGGRREVTLDDPRSGQNVAAAAISQDKSRVLVAEKGKTLKLYDLSASRSPVARFEVPGIEWKAVGFLNEPDRIAGETTKGEFYVWPFFKDRNALIEFAKKSLPLDQNLKTIELSQEDKCRFGVETKSPPCSEN